MHCADGAYGSAWNIAGPGVITVRRFAELVFATTGRNADLRVADEATLRMLGESNPFLREVVEMHYLSTTSCSEPDIESMYAPFLFWLPNCGARFCSTLGTPCSTRGWSPHCRVCTSPGRQRPGVSAH